MTKFDPRLSETITLSQASQYADCSVTVLRSALVRGDMQGVKIAEIAWLTTRQEVDRYFQAKQADWLNKRRRHERAAKIRAGWTCTRCHHPHQRGIKYLTIYYKDGDHENYSPHNMLALCVQCYFFTITHYHPKQMLLPGFDLPDWLR